MRGHNGQLNTDGRVFSTGEGNTNPAVLEYVLKSADRSIQYIVGVILLKH